MNWQPISTAESAHPLLLWDEEHGMCVGFRYDGKWVMPVYDSLWGITPKYWQPLPDPPIDDESIQNILKGVGECGS